MLPQASINCVDEYSEELYEENMDLKARGAQRILRLCTEAKNLEVVADHSTLCGVLSRELRENAKRSHELAVAITGIFLCFGHFVQFHPLLVRHQCTEAAMRILEYEAHRSMVLKKDLDTARGKVDALGEQATKEQLQALKKDETRHSVIEEKQDRLLTLCIALLRDLCEDTAIEKTLVGQRLVQFLLQLVHRSREEMLVGALMFLHKLTVFEVNTECVLHQADSMKRLAELTTDNSPEVSLWALRVCYNLSFHEKGRAVLGVGTNVVAAVIANLGKPALEKIARKLLYHLSMDGPTRAGIANEHPDCVKHALHQTVQNNNSKIKQESIALCINFATEAVCAAVMIDDEKFPKVVNRTLSTADPYLLKVLRHIASHERLRTRLLQTMRKASGSDQWLHEVVRVCVENSESAEVLVEGIGILACLDLPSPEVPWPELCTAGLLDLLHRLLMVGFSDDDVLLECVQLTAVIALDADCGPLLAGSRVPSVLPGLLTEKQEDGEIVVQLLFTLRCLLMRQETREVVLCETDAPERVLQLLKDAGQMAATQQAVKDAAEETLDLIIEADRSGGGAPQWLERIKAFKFELANEEWLNGLQDSHRPAREIPKADFSNRLEAERGATYKWSDASTLADRCWAGGTGSGAQTMSTEVGAMGRTKARWKGSA
jgi:hypothetical protein